jgi:hypothetical protein
MRKRCKWIHDHARWTQPEKDYLRASRGTMSAKAMAAALLGRTPEAVQSRCKQLKLFKRDLRPVRAPKRDWRRWSADEVAILKRHAGTLRPKTLCYLFLEGRTGSAVDVEIRQLGLPLWSQRSSSLRRCRTGLQVAA